MRSLGAIELFNQDLEPRGTMIVDACGGFIKLSRLEIIWTVCHLWPAEARFAFNYYRHTILIRERVTQGYPFSMVLYRITLVPLAEELRAADSSILSPLYVDYTVFDLSARSIAQLLNLLMEMGPDWGYFPKLATSLLISDTLGPKEAARLEFAAEVLVLNFVSGSWYLGGYLSPKEELAAWVKPQVEAWAHGVRVLGQISRQHPQLYYAGLVMSLQL